MAKITYNKQKPGRILMGRGPRDLQLRQKLELEKSIREVSPSITATHENVSISSPQQLPLEEVRKKLDEAVTVAKEEERKRYESGLKNLNDQLNAMRKKASLAEEKLVNANAEIAKLTNVIQSSKSVSNEEINNFKNTIKELKDLLAVKETQLAEANKSIADLSKTKDELVAKTHVLENKVTELTTRLESSVSSNELITDLQNQLNQLYQKISDGSIEPLVGSKIPRPELETRIFIDPLDESVKEREGKLDTHIKVEEENKPIKRSVEQDIHKLRKLLKL